MFFQLESYKRMKNVFGSDIFENLKNGKINKKEFAKKYKLMYNKTFELILEGIKNEQK